MQQGGAHEADDAVGAPVVLQGAAGDPAGAVVVDEAAAVADAVADQRALALLEGGGQQLPRGAVGDGAAVVVDDLKVVVVVVDVVEHPVEGGALVAELGPVVGGEDAGDDARAEVLAQPGAVGAAHGRAEVEDLLDAQQGVLPVRLAQQRDDHGRYADDGVGAEAAGEHQEGLGCGGLGGGAAFERHPAELGDRRGQSAVEVAAEEGVDQAVAGFQSHGVEERDGLADHVVPVGAGVDDVARRAGGGAAAQHLAGGAGAAGRAAAGGQRVRGEGRLVEHGKAGQVVQGAYGGQVPVVRGPAGAGRGVAQPGIEAAGAAGVLGGPGGGEGGAVEAGAPAEGRGPGGAAVAAQHPGGERVLPGQLPPGPEPRHQRLGPGAAGGGVERGVPAGASVRGLVPGGSRVPSRAPGRGPGGCVVRGPGPLGEGQQVGYAQRGAVRGRGGVPGDGAGGGQRQARAVEEGGERLPEAGVGGAHGDVVAGGPGEQEAAQGGAGAVVVEDEGADGAQLVHVVGVGERLPGVLGEAAEELVEPVGELLAGPEERSQGGQSVRVEQLVEPGPGPVGLLHREQQVGRVVPHDPPGSGRGGGRGRGRRCGGQRGRRGGGRSGGRRGGRSRGGGGGHAASSEGMAAASAQAWR